MMDEVLKAIASQHVRPSYQRAVSHAYTHTHTHTHTHTQAAGLPGSGSRMDPFLYALP